MSTAQQLYRLQEIELEIESKEQSVLTMTGQLGDSPELVQTRTALAAEQRTSEELKKQQHTLQWEDDDLTGKLKKAEEELYSGRIKNPKELGNLQSEISGFKNKRGQIDEKLLILMDKIEDSGKKLADLTERCKRAETASRELHQQLVTNIETAKNSLAELQAEKQALLESLESQTNRLYYDLKKKRKTAVAKVSQGTCSACRIQLSITDVQKVRSGSVIQCSSCQRILYLP